MKKLLLPNKSLTLNNTLTNSYTSGFCLQCEWVKLAFIPKPHCRCLFAPALITINRNMTFFQFPSNSNTQMADTHTDTRALFILILSLLLLVLCWRLHHEAKLNHTAHLIRREKKIYKCIELNCIPKECIYVRLPVQKGSSRSCKALIQIKYLKCKTVGKQISTWSE